MVLKIKSKICSMTFMWNLKDYKHLNLYVYGFVGGFCFVLFCFVFYLCKLFQNQVIAFLELRLGLIPEFVFEF